MFIREIIQEDLPSPSPSSIHREIGLGFEPRRRDNRQGAHPDVVPFNKYSSHSKSLNDYLHQTFRNPKHKADSLYRAKIGNFKGLDKNFKLLPPLTKPIKVYSGIPESPSILWEKHGVDTNLPIKAHLPAYTSTTTDLRVAMDFGRSGMVNIKKHTPHEIIGSLTKYEAMRSVLSGFQVLYIEVPKGYNAVSLKSISKYATESEILLPRGLDIMINPHPIIKKKFNSLYFFWGCRVIGHNPVNVVMN